MLLGARQFFAARKATHSIPTARDYVQDGLVAMWDGIENAGWGVHDSSANSWVDVIKGIVAGYSGYGGAFQITNDGYDFALVSEARGAGVLKANIGADANLVRQIETVYCTNAETAIAALLLSGFSDRQFVCGNLSGSVFVSYGYSQVGDAGVSSRRLHSYSVSLTGGWPIMSACFCDGRSLDVSGYASGFTSVQPYETGRVFLGFMGILGTGFTVSVKSVRFYSRALAAEEVAANSAIDKARFNLP